MRKWVRNLLKGTSLSTALFIFQACYGMPQGYEDFGLEFQVIDVDTKKPIPDAGVMFRQTGDGSWMNAGKTDQSGHTDIRVYDIPSLDLKFEAESYQAKDTCITDLSPRTITIEMRKEQ